MIRPQTPLWTTSFIGIDNGINIRTLVILATAGLPNSNLSWTLRQNFTRFIDIVRSTKTALYLKEIRLPITKENAT